MDKKSLPYEEIRQEIIRLQDEWHVPGVAVGIVVEGELVFAEGFGYRDHARRKPVTPHTLFPIASCSKAFTTMSIALLAEEGKLDWDTPIKKYIPWFELQDSYAAERATLRDLACHRTGLPRHELVWLYQEQGREKIVRKLKYLEPSKDFRTTYQYQNLTYMTMGYLVEKVTGMPWEMFVKRRILEPLSMRDTCFSVSEMTKVEDYAQPFLVDEEKVIPTEFYKGDIYSAGGMFSNIHDLARWVHFHLNEGKIGNESLISPGMLSQMQQPHIPIIQLVDNCPEIALPSYGLGWTMEAFRGRKLISHGGNIFGFSLLVSFMPRERIGIIFLCNANASPLRDLLPYRLYDLLFNEPEVDWSARFREKHEKMRWMLKEMAEKQVPERVENTSPSHALEEYMGVFRHPAYGQVRVELERGGLYSNMHHFMSG